MRCWYWMDSPHQDYLKSQFGCGCGSNYARKKGLLIVMAGNVVRLQDESEVIIGAHEMVYNEGSLTTLISKFQVQRHGLILDYIYKDHNCEHHRWKEMISSFPFEGRQDHIIGDERWPNDVP